MRSLYDARIMVSDRMKATTIPNGGFADEATTRLLLSGISDLEEFNEFAAELWFNVLNHLDDEGVVEDAAPVFMGMILSAFLVGHYTA